MKKGTGTAKEIGGGWCLFDLSEDSVTRKIKGGVRNENHCKPDSHSTDVIMHV